MFSQSIRNVIEPKRFLTATADETVSNACRLMQTRNVGAVLVISGNRLIGIFTERDAVFRVIVPGLDPGKTPLRDVMTAQPLTIGPEKTYGHAMLLMHENGFRHLPVIENGGLIGIVSSRNAMDPALEEFVWEERRREHYRQGNG
ncbi:MAG: CBS domain-containing protein [Comamonadaceae bacterium]